MDVFNSSFLPTSACNANNFYTIQTSGQPISLDLIRDHLLLLIGVFTLCFAFLSHGALWDKPDPLHHLWYERPQGDANQNGQMVAESRDIAYKLAESVNGLQPS
jgi:hypothetical protein